MKPEFLNFEIKKYKTFKGAIEYVRSENYVLKISFPKYERI